MERVLKKLAVGAVAFAVILFLANLLVDNPYTHRLIRAAIDAEVKHSTNLTVDFKAIKVEVAPPGVELYGLSVAPNNQPDSPLVSASHANARVSLWALLLGRVRIARIELDDLGIVWPPPPGFAGFLKDQSGKEELPGLVTWPPRFDLPVDRITLRNAKAVVQVPLFSVPEAPSELSLATVGVDADFRYDGWRDLKLDVTAKSVDFALGAAPLLEDTKLEAQIALSGDTLTVSPLTLDGQRLKLDASTEGVLRTGEGHVLNGIHTQTKGKVDGDLSVLGSFLDLADTRGRVTGDVDARIDVPIAVGGKPEFEIKGHGQAQQARLYGFRLYNSRTAFDITPERVKLDDIDVIIGEQTVAKGAGTIKINDATDFDFRAQPKGLRLLDLLSALKVDFGLADTTLDAPDLHVSGKGSPFNLAVSANVQASDITLPETPYDHSAFPKSPVCRLDLRLLVTSAQLDFNGTHGTCGPSAVELSGQVKFDEPTTDIDLRVRSPSLDLSVGQYFAQIPLAGTAAVETRIHGPSDHVLIDSRLDGRDVKVRGAPAGTVTALVGIDGKVVKWREAEAHPPSGGVLRSHGQLDVGSPDMRVKADLTATAINRETIRQLIQSIASDVDFAATVPELTAKLDAPLYHPLAGTGQAHVVMTDATLDGETLFDNLQGSVQGTSKGWSTQDLTATLATMTVGARIEHQRVGAFNLQAAEAKGASLVSQLGLSSHDRLTADLKTADEKPVLGPESKSRPDQLQKLPYAGSALKEAQIQGRITLNTKLTGTLSQLQGTLDASLHDLSVLGNPMAPVRAKGFVRGSRLDLVVDHAGGALEGRLSLDLFADGVPYEWFLHLDRMDLRALGTPLFHEDPRNFLYLTADWHMQGRLRDWWRSQGELDVKDIRGKYVQDLAGQTKTLQIHQEQPVTLLLTKEGWRFKDDRDLYLSGRNLQVRVSMNDSHPPERLGLRVESIVDMAIAKEFSQEVETAEGKLRIVAEVKGSTSDPKPTVEVTDLKPNPFIAATWKPVSLGLADVRPAFRNVRLRVLYDGGHLVIDKFSAEKGSSGTVTASGALSLTGTPGDESHVDISLNDATIVYPVAFLKSFETQVSGNVTLSGQGVPYKLAGDLTINKARSTREVDIRDEIINALRQKSFSTALVAEKPTFLFDLNVSAEQTINIHNRNLQALLSTDLHVRGSDIAPQVSGQVEVDKGKFIYKRDFQITRGLVTFDDPVKPDPSLDVLAVSDVDAYRVYIAITGRASDPKVEFSIDPPNRETGTPISKLEILVLLSNGKLPEETRQVNTADVQKETQNAAASEAASLILGQFEEPVEKLLDASGQNVVRNVYIDTHPSPVDGSPVPRFNLPLDLGEDFDLVVREDQTATEATLEYNVNENINLNLSGIRGMGAANSYESTTTTPLQTTTAGGNNPAVDMDAKVHLKFRFSWE